MNDDRISRLPNWAQQHIERLERKVAEADARVAQVCGTEAPAPRAAVLDFYGARPSIPLPAGRIVFPVHGVSIWVDSGDELCVMTDGALAFGPRSTNTAAIVSLGRGESVYRRVVEA